LNVTIISIPPGLTSSAQPANISWNKPFKGFLRTKWTEKLMSDMKEMQELRATAPIREQLLKWINEAWNYLSEETIVSGFVKANMISKDVDLSEQTIPTVSESQQLEQLNNALEGLEVI